MGGSSTVGLGVESQRSSSESLDAGILSLLPLSPEVREAVESVKYIAENMRLQNEAKEVSVCDKHLKQMLLSDMTF